MNVVKRTSVAFLAAVVLFTSTYATTIEVQATSIVAGMTLAELLEYLAITYGYSFFGAETVKQLGFTNGFNDWLESEGFGEVKAVAAKAGVTINDVTDIRDFLDTSVAGNISGYYDVVKPLVISYVNHLEKSGVLDAYDQDIIYNSVLPDYIHVGERLSFNDAGGLKSFPDVFSDNSYYCSTGNSGMIQSNWYYDLRFPSGYDMDYFSYYYYLVKGTFFVTYALRDGFSLVSSHRYDSAALDSLYPDLKFSVFSVFASSATSNIVPTSFAVPTYNFYVSGNFFIELDDGTLYYIDAQGLIYDEEGEVIAISITTEEGYLMSAKAIVNKGFADYTKSLADELDDVIAKYPDITKQQFEQIIENISNFYNETVENYYQDTTYIEGDTYIEEITNIFEEVINPAIDVPEFDDTGIIEAIKSIPASISKVLTDIFVPDPDDIKPYVDDVLSHFKWAKEPWDFMKELVSIIFTGVTEPPVIYIDFRLAESDIKYGGREVALDLSWYARYKPAVDTIIVGFCWIWFGYWFFRNLPEIISGSSPAAMLRSKEKAESKIESDHNKVSGK